MTLPKAAQAILKLPGVESIHRETDGWVCYLRHGWTTEIMGGSSTVIDTNLAAIRSYVKNAYQMEVEP